MKIFCSEKGHNLKVSFKNRGGGGGYFLIRLMGMCRWMLSHFHDWIDYNGIAFSIELLEWGCTFCDFFGGRQFFIFRVSKRSKMKVTRSSFNIR